MSPGSDETPHENSDSVDGETPRDKSFEERRGQGKGRKNPGAAGVGGASETGGEAEPEGRADQGEVGLQKPMPAHDVEEGDGHNGDVRCICDACLAHVW